MTWRVLILLLALLLTCPLACRGGPRRGSAGPATTRAGGLSEEQKIEGLIAAVASMKDAKFIRNGSTYDGGTAARLMRYKWEQNAKEIKSARDFIGVAGTRSKTSGQEYRVLFNNGTSISSAEFLLGKLKEIEMP